MRCEEGRRPEENASKTALKKVDMKRRQWLLSLDQNYASFGQHIGGLA